MYFANSFLGWFHLFTALAALIAGTFVLASTKGTKQHKRVGYAYVALMVLVCSSALCIYRLTGSFGVFHVTAIVGFITLACGITPMLIPGLNARYRAVHIWFMYYSVLGLYAAFASELFVRVPNQPFYAMVGVTTGTIFLVGTFFIVAKEKSWTKFFSQVENKKLQSRG